MKRIGVFFLCAMLFFSIGGCSGNGASGLSEEMKEFGVAAVETADDFLDGNITGDEAIKRLEKNSFRVDLQLDREEREAESDTESRTGANGGSLVSSSILLLQMAISDKNDGTGTEKDVIENRNRLAEIVGISKR